ncbi:MAG: LysR family transcriptional regulator [Sulfitobacter sp.]
MESWDEVRTAYQVARRGTVSGAAEALGVHHATVIRHIDALEARLGVKLFQRHARGYTPTEAGEDLLRVAQATDDQLNQLASRMKGSGKGVAGDLVVTSLVALAPRITPLLVAFQQKHPDVVVRYLTGDRLFRLEYGEAHVAIRGGAAPPDQPDNVVQRFGTEPVHLYATKGYIERHGMPDADDGFGNHCFVGPEDPKNRAPWFQWLDEQIPRERVTFRSDDSHARSLAVLHGAALGFLSPQEAAEFGDLVVVSKAGQSWSAPVWLVTHMDLHRSSKVQAFLAFLKDAMKDHAL